MRHSAVLLPRCGSGRLLTVMSVGRRPGTPVIELVEMAPTASTTFYQDVAEKRALLRRPFSKPNENWRAHILHADVGHHYAVHASAIHSLDVDAADRTRIEWTAVIGVNDGVAEDDVFQMLRMWPCPF